jgi:hypothetical protein
VKITKNQLKELVRQSIDEVAPAIAAVGRTIARGAATKLADKAVDKLTAGKKRKKDDLEELNFDSQAQYDSYKKKHKIKHGTKITVGGKDTTAGKADSLSKGDVGGPAHVNVPTKKKDVSTQMADKEKNKNISKGDKDKLGKLSKMMGGEFDDEYSSNTDGYGGLPLSKDDLKDPEVQANIKKRNSSSDGHPSEDDFFKNGYKEIESRVDGDNPVQADTEYHGSVTINDVDREARRMMGTNQEGEDVELDYGDIVRFDNAFRTGDMEKDMDKAVNDANEKMAFDQVPRVRKLQITNAEPGYIKPEHMAKTHKALEKAGSNKADGFKSLSDKYQQIQKDSVAKYKKLKDKNPKAAEKAFYDGVSEYTKVGIEMQKLMGHDAEEIYKDVYDSYNPKLKEVRSRRHTVKEVRMWMKKLEENRYKKVYNSDARRVAWMVNNEGVELSEMPKSMSKKWTKAQYGRERYLAKEFIKHLESKQITEQKLRKTIRKIIKEGKADVQKHSDELGAYLRIMKPKIAGFKFSIAFGSDAWEWSHPKLDDVVYATWGWEGKPTVPIELGHELGGDVIKTLKYNAKYNLKKDAIWYLSNMKRYLPGILKDNK